MADGGGLTAPIQLTADLVARAVIAAAASYGDDPVIAMSSPRNSKARRTLGATANALFEHGVRPEAIERMLGVKKSTIYSARCKPGPGYGAATDAAASELAPSAADLPPPRAIPAFPAFVKPYAPPAKPAGPRILTAAAVRREILLALEDDNATAPDLSVTLNLTEGAVRQGLRELAESGEARADPLTEEGWRKQFWRKAAR